MWPLCWDSPGCARVAHELGDAGYIWNTYFGIFCKLINHKIVIPKRKLYIDVMVLKSLLSELNQI